MAKVSLSSFDSLDFRKLRMFLFEISDLKYSLRTPSSPFRNLRSQRSFWIIVVLERAGEDAEVAGLPEVAQLLEEDGAVPILDEVVDDRLDVRLLQEDLQLAERDGVERQAHGEVARGDEERLGLLQALAEALRREDELDVLDVPL